eukprot:EST49547.1 Dynein heavy chain [Spironucleus salmonicida]
MADRIITYLADVASRVLCTPPKLTLTSLDCETTATFLEASDQPLFITQHGDQILVKSSPPTTDSVILIITRRIEAGDEPTAIEAPEDCGPQQFKLAMISQLNFMVNEPNVLRSISDSLDKIFPAMMPGQNESELTFQSKKLAVQASTTDQQLKSDFTISIPEDIVIGNAKAAQSDVATMNNILKQLELWTPIVQKAFDTYNQLTHQSDTPMDEIELWRHRSALIGTLYENMMTPEFKKLIQVIEPVTNQVVTHFITLRTELTKNCLESRDNTRFLSTLERHFKLLQRAPIQTLPDVINSLYAAIRMVWTISRYYNTEERLLPLMEKIALQICRRVQSSIIVSELFSTTVKPVQGSSYGENIKDQLFGIQLLKATKSVLLKWSDSYYQTRTQIEEHNKEARRWEFDKQILFKNTNFQTERINVLIKCVEQIQEFDQIISTDVQQVTGDTGGVRMVKAMIAELPEKLIAFGDEIWNIDNNEAFQEIITLFNINVKKAEVRSFEFIDQSFTKLRSVSQALDLIIKLQTAQQISNSSSILANHMKTKTEDIIQQYVTELTRTEKEFDLKHKSPPIGIDLPKIAGTLVWCRSLYAAIKTPMDQIKQLPKESQELLVTKEASSVFSGIQQSLKSYEKLIFNRWKQEADAIIMKSLSSPLLGEKPVVNIDILRSNNDTEFIIQENERVKNPPLDALKSDENITYISPSVTALILRRQQHEMCVNFPPELNELIDEVKILDRLGFSVGETALNVALQKQKYEKHAEGLKQLINQINSALSEFLTAQALDDVKTNNITTETAHVLIEKAVQKASIIIRPGFGPLNWNSLSVDDYLERSISAASELQQTCQQMLKTIGNVEQNIKFIKNTKLVPSQQILFSGSELSYAAANPQNLVNVSIDPTKYANLPPEQAMRAAARDMELKAAAMNEKMFEDLASLSLQEFSERIEEYRNRQVTLALEKYSGLTQLLLKIEENANLGNDTGKLEKYYKFWAQKVFNALIQMVTNALKDYNTLIKGQTVNNKEINNKFLKYNYTPLFHLQASLQLPEILVNPSIEQLRNTLNYQVEAIARVAQPFVLWEDGTVKQHNFESATSQKGAQILISSDATTLRKSELFEFRKQAQLDDVTLQEEVVVRSFHIQVINQSTVTTIITDIQEKVQQTLVEIQKYVNSWSKFTDFYKNQRLQVINKFQQFELSSSDFDYLLHFFTSTAQFLEQGKQEKTFVLNSNKKREKASLLTVLVDGQSQESNEIDDLQSFKIDENSFFRIPENCNLMQSLPFSGEISSHPPYRAIVVFCILEGTQLAESIINECYLWRDCVMRMVIEKARPLLLELYQTCDLELKQVSEECAVIDNLKSVLQTIVRIQQNTMSIELKSEGVFELYRLIYLYDGIIGNSEHDQEVQLLSLQSNSDFISEITQHLNYGFSYGSLFKFVQNCETMAELCNSEVGPLATTSITTGGSGQPSGIELSFLTGKSENMKKKIFKTVNCKIHHVEMVAAQDFKRKWETIQVHSGLIDGALDATKKKFSDVTAKQSKEFEKQLQAFILQFKESGPMQPIQLYNQEFNKQQIDNTFVPSRSISQTLDVVSDVYSEIKSKLDAMIKEKDKTLLAQRLFNQEPISCAGLPAVEREMDKFGTILVVYGNVKENFSDWDRILFAQLNAKMLETGCDTLMVQLARLGVDFKHHKCYELVETMIIQYKQSIPLLEDLTNKALRQRHWVKVEEACNQQIFSGNENSNLTLGQITSLDLSKYKDAISDIVIGAQKELQIESDLAKIAEIWTQTRLPIQKFTNSKGKERGYVLRSLDEIMLIIEDNSMSLQSMSSSKYVAVFTSDVRLWEKRLGIISDVLESWLQYQRQWMYLEGIFAGSEDLRVQLPDEAKRFDRIDMAFVKLMSEMGKTNPNVYDACSASGRLDMIKAQIASMDACQKALTDYLNSKRSQYQRFYFISDDELLSILGSASDPTSVQEHMRKMFDNVASLEFQRGSNNIVIGMNSPEGEQLMYNTIVKIEQNAPIEQWMTQIDNEMKESLRIAIKTGIYDFGANYAQQDRVQWVHKHIGQVCIVASEVYHTWDCEDAFRLINSDSDNTENHNAMKVNLQRKNEQIDNLVTEIRTDLSKTARIKINTLLIVDIHHQTILDELIKQNVIKTSDFNYESQLRFYYLARQDNLQILQTTPPAHPYLFEYQGLGGRLVVTPLLDRLNMTITTALNKGFFGAPAGPAGTGKTEGVKDLSKQLGRMCVVINCSEGLDVRAMGSILSGACEAGCWICFDEFNRIEPAVLSVISQQVKIILNALKLCTVQEGSKDIPSVKFLFEGRDIVLRNTAGVFCTMNPGYAGRSELPDNLKVLFRPVVMSKPNLSTICENMLFSEGFVTARVLAMKMTVLYKLASEQLSKQYHYDFGLRALKSVLVNAGKLKRQQPDEDEDRVLMRALRDMNLPKFIFEDVPLFMGLITDLCPGIKIDEDTPKEGGKESKKSAVLDMKAAAQNALSALSMEVIPDQVLKVQQFYDTLGSRHSVMMVGPTGGGKSVIRQAYARANSEMGIKTFYQIVNPKAQTVNELYGVLNPDTREWQDGLLSKIFRNLNSPEFSGNDKVQNIILFDGDVDALWIENMNSVMDDNKLLTLPNNERIRMLDNCKLVFEVADLQYASPATVSRCGMVWVDTKNLGYAPRFMRWIREKFTSAGSGEQKTDLTDAKNNALQLYNKYIPQLLDYIYNGVRINSSSGQPEVVGLLKLAMPVTDLNLVNQFCVLFDDCVKKAEEGSDQVLKYPQDVVFSQYKASILNDPLILEALFLFCIIWSIGAGVDEHERGNLDSYLRELSGLPMKSGVATNETVSASHFPGGIITSASSSGIGGQQQSTLFDFYFDLRRQVWCPWSSFLLPYQPGPDRSFANIVVETQDTIRNTWVLDTFVKAGRNVLFVGESGTAKTTIVKNYLRSLDPETFNTLSMNFSSRTGATEVQTALEDNLEKRLKDLGPPAGKKLVFFVDEISMPTIDIYGTQQPIALLKLFTEGKGIYDKKALIWKKVIDVQSIGCLPIPGGSHNKLDPRFVSLFCSLNIATPSEDALTHIYSSILSSHLKSANFQFDLSDSEANYRYIDTLSKKLTTATLVVYTATLQALSPTPSRFHYLFNLRDLSRVYEGLTFASPDKFKNTSLLLKLWRNEFTRIFCDRLICQEDKDLVNNKIASTINEYFGDVDQLDVVLDNNLIFGDFREIPKLLENYDSQRNGIEPENVCFRSYEELIDGEPEERQAHKNEDDDIIDEAEAEKQPEIVEEEQKQPEEVDESVYRLARKLAHLGLDSYNQHIKPPLHGIVLFDDAVSHLLRLHKILRTPKGCALLVGYGGSGRRSLTRLATYMAGYELFEIQLSKSYTEVNFKEDLKSLYMRLAPPANINKQITFLFTDQHVADESFLEAINSILTTGIVPALFSSDEKEQCINLVRNLAIENGVPETKDALWTFFVNSCRERLHIVLSMSPVGEVLRQRCRSFPGLVSSCVIDWYESWSDDGLRTVSKSILTVSKTQQIQIADDSIFPDRPVDQLPELKKQLIYNIIEHALQVHKTAVVFSEEYWQSIRRRNFVTPRNFVDFLQTYLKILSQKRYTCMLDIDKFKKGLDKLSQAKSEVDVMQVELEERKIILDEKTKSCTVMLTQIEEQTLETNKLQQQANTKNEELSKQSAAIEIDKSEAEAQLLQALPALEAAEQALQNLNNSEIAEIRTLKVAPKAVEDIIGCVYALKENSISNIDWGTSKGLLGDLKNELTNFDKSRLAQRSVNYTKTITSKLTDESVQKSSGAALCIYKWVLSMQKYYEVAKDVEPKRKKVREAEAMLDKAKKELTSLQQTLEQLSAESAILKEKLDAAQAEQQELADAAELMAKRLDAAQRLITGLSTEKVRWAAEADKLQKIQRQYVGDCLVTSAMMSYAGGFTFEFRNRLIQAWVSDCSDRKIPLSIEFDDKNNIKQYRPELLLVSDVEVLNWGSEGLPSDELSVMNGVMITRTSKWPLIIDPQLQTSRWIKEKEKSNQLIVRTQNDDDFLKQLENAIQYGRPFLLDNVGESLDPILTSVLEKDIRIKGSSQKTVRLGDKDVDYDNNFKLYLTSKLFNPQLPPDIFSTLSVINHCVTESGLESQLLNVVVKRERPDIEQQREKLVKTMAAANDTLKSEEEKLLVALSTATGNIVDNTELITTLEKAKAKALEVTEALASMKITAEQTEAARQNYLPVAVRGRVCYFAMSVLATINTMYQYSLQAFMDIFTKSLTDATADSNVEQRIINVIETLTDNVYNLVCTSLFEKHKLMFSFMLTTRIIMAEYNSNAIPYAELDFFVKGDFSLDDCPVLNPHNWIAPAGWKDLIKLNQIFKSSQLNQADQSVVIGSVKKFVEQCEDSNVTAKFPTITSEIFADLVNDITNNDKPWKAYWDHERPETLQLPGKIGENPFVTDLQKLCILRCLRPDRVYIAVGQFVASIIGEKYITPPVLSFDYIYKQSTRSTPILFIITPGSDPLNQIMALAKKHDFLNSRFKFVALGQGQSPIAENYVKTGITRGQWILLMNCHLLPKWLKQLDKILEPVIAVEQLIQMQSQTQEEEDGTVVENTVLQQLNKSVNEDFRLFMTTEPTDNFPLAVLQNSIKIVTEPPNSLRLNVMSTFSKLTEDQLSACPSPYFRPLIFTLAFFHASIQERQKFGKIGWNVKYDFNDSDFAISLDVISTYLTNAHLQNTEIPWESIRYLIGEVNYGGRVMDDWDRRLVSCYLGEFFGDFLFDTHQKFSFFKDDDFNYQIPPVVEVDKSLNPSVQSNLVISSLLQTSAERYGDKISPEIVDSVLKEQPSIKRIYEAYFINKIPLISTPLVFGLHSNAEISYLEAASREMWLNLAELQPRTQSADSIQKEDFLIGLCKTLETRVPTEIDLLAARKKFKIPQPTDIVLLQEIERFNRLLVVMRENILDLQRALAGEIGMSSDLDGMANMLFVGQMPQKWRKFAPATLKNLSGWMQHLINRADQYKKWLALGEPAVVWLSGLHIPESYLTALVQTCSRIKKWPLDRSALFTQVSGIVNSAEVKSKLEFGTYLQGLFLEGASWSAEHECLVSSRKKELMVQLPLVKVIPAEASRIKLRNQFKAPVYVTTARTNAMGVGLVFAADVASFDHESLWILQGVAVLLNDN